MSALATASNMTDKIFVRYFNLNANMPNRPFNAQMLQSLIIQAKHLGLNVVFANELSRNNLINLENSIYNLGCFKLTQAIETTALKTFVENLQKQQIAFQVIANVFDLPHLKDEDLNLTKAMSDTFWHVLTKAIPKNCKPLILNLKSAALTNAQSLPLFKVGLNKSYQMEEENVLARVLQYQPATNHKTKLAYLPEANVRSFFKNLTLSNNFWQKFVELNLNETVINKTVVFGYINKILPQVPLHIKLMEYYTSGNPDFSELIERYLCNFLFEKYQQTPNLEFLNEFIKNQPNLIADIKKKANQKIQSFNQKVDAINSDQEALLNFEFWFGDQLKQRPDLLKTFYAESQSPQSKEIYKHYQQQYQKLKVNSNVFFENVYLPYQLSSYNLHAKNNNVLSKAQLTEQIQTNYQSILLSHRTLEQRKAFYKKVHLEYVNNSLMIKEMNYELAKQVTNQYIGKASNLIEEDIISQFKKVFADNCELYPEQTACFSFGAGVFDVVENLCRNINQQTNRLPEQKKALIKQIYEQMPLPLVLGEVSTNDSSNQKVTQYFTSNNNRAAIYYEAQMLA